MEPEESKALHGALSPGSLNSEGEIESESSSELSLTWCPIFSVSSLSYPTRHLQLAPLQDNRNGHTALPNFCQKLCAGHLQILVLICPLKLHGSSLSPLSWDWNFLIFVIISCASNHSPTLPVYALLSSELNLLFLDSALKIAQP